MVYSRLLLLLSLLLRKIAARDANRKIDHIEMEFRPLYFISSSNLKFCIVSLYSRVRFIDDYQKLKYIYLGMEMEI